MNPFNTCRIIPVLLLLLFGGCGRDPITVQKNVPKEYDERLRWVLPDGWTVTDPASTMQMAAFLIVDGDENLRCSITSFEGLGGTDLENLNRWLRQLGRPATDEKGMSALRKNLFLGTHFFTLFNLGDEKFPEGKHFIAAILRENNRSWFFKLEGSLAGVSAQLEAFEIFLKSIRLQGEPDELPVPDSEAKTVSTRPAPHPVPVGGGVKIAKKGEVPPGTPSPPTTPPPLPPGGLPPPPRIPPEVLEKMRKTAPPALPSALQKQLGSVKTPAWQVPAGWNSLPPTPMRRGNFTIPGEGGSSASVTVIHLPANSGALDANIRRWGGQVGLSPADLSKNQPPIQQMEIGGAKANYVVLRGSEKSVAIAVVGKSNGTGTWFFKMLGDNSVMEKQRLAFEGFLESVKF